MSAPNTGRERWGMSMAEAVGQVRALNFPSDILTNIVAARLDVPTENVQVEIAYHLGRPYLRIEVAT